MATLGIAGSVACAIPAEEAVVDEAAPLTASTGEGDGEAEPAEVLDTDTTSTPPPIAPDPALLSPIEDLQVRASAEAVIIAMDIVEVGGKWFVTVATDLAAGTTSRIEISVLEGTSRVLTEGTMKKVNAAIETFESQAARAGRRVGVLRTGATISLGLLFFLGIEGSVAIGKEAGVRVDEWIKKNNHGESCAKLFRWLSVSSKAPLSGDPTCEECYDARINTGPSNKTLATCVAEMQATHQKTEWLVAAVNERAKGVVGSCGSKRGSWLDRGGYAWKMGYEAPKVDFLPGKEELPSLEAVCPVP